MYQNTYYHLCPKKNHTKPSIYETIETQKTQLFMHLVLISVSNIVHWYFKGQKTLRDLVKHFKNVDPRQNIQFRYI